MIRGYRLVLRWGKSLHAWVYDATTLIRLSVLVVVPLVMAVVTWLSNISDLVAFLLFPPLAAGTYSLIVDPRDASPRLFVGGITTGALSGWAAVIVTESMTGAAVAGAVPPAGAAMSVLFAGLTSWMFRLEEPAAFSTALLVLVTGTSEVVYVGGMIASTLMVAGGFLVYRDQVYAPGVEYLYHTIGQAHSVVVPVTDATGTARAHFAAQLAAGAGSRGRIVLLNAAEEAPSETGRETATEVARELEVRYDVDTDVVVTSRDPAAAEIATVAQDTTSDLIVAPFDPETPEDFLPFVRAPVDVIGLKTVPDRRSWARILVGISGREQTDRTLVEIADRIGTELSLYHYSKPGGRRRERERLLADLLETTTATTDTRIGDTPPDQFFPHAAAGYNLLAVGASMDRRAVSRTVVPPRFYTVDADCDIAVVNRSDRPPAVE